jgi:phage gp36-like protein
MPNYTTTAKLKARFEDEEEVAALTDTLAETGAPDETVLAEVIADAEGEIDSYLAVRYLVPVVVSGHTVLANRLNSLALDIAVVNLLERGHQVSEAQQRRRDRATTYLEKLSVGELLLPSATTLTTTTTNEPLIAYGTAGTGDDTNRLFSRTTQDGV